MMNLARLTSLSLRTKLTAAIAIPVVGLFALSALEVRDLTSVASETQAQLDVVEDNVTIAEVAAAIRDERDLIVNVMGSTAPVNPAEDSWNVYYEGIRVSTGETIADALTGSSLEAADAASIADIEQRLEELRERNGTDLYAVSDGLVDDMMGGASAQDPGTTMESLAIFDQIVADTIRLIDIDTDLNLDAETTLDITTLQLSSTFDEAIRREAISYLALSLVPREDQTAEMVQLARAKGSESAQLERIVGEIGNTELAPTFNAFLQGSDYQSFVDVRDRVATGEIGEIGVPRSTVFFVLLALTNDLDDIKTEIIERATATAVDNNSAAQQRLLIGGLALAALVALVAVIAFVLFRSIRRPLLTLTGRSRAIADEELPNVVSLLRSEGVDAQVPEIVPIEAETTDEVGQLVEAFNDMHRTAVELAAEQAASRRTVADMFVNLGRRNQRLLMRILDYLDGLERNEEDPQTLESLFKIDHLATRMRRNAESLLVLAGAREARVFDQPVAVADVVRSALGEVEGYERVDLDVRTEKFVDGAAVADMAHLLAELIENGLAFSPPSSRVTVSAAESPKGFVVAVADEGIGMSSDAIASANDTITRAMTLEETPSKDLGHHVVGRLAGRHEIEVELLEGITDGLVARVKVPSSLLSDPKSDDDETLADLFASSEHEAADTSVDDVSEHESAQHASQERDVIGALQLSVVPEPEADATAGEPTPNLEPERVVAEPSAATAPIAAQAPQIADAEIPVIEPTAATWSDPDSSKPLSVAEASKLARGQQQSSAPEETAPRSVPSVLETTSGFALARRQIKHDADAAPIAEQPIAEQPIAEQPAERAPLKRRRRDDEPASAPSNPLLVARKPGTNLPAGVKPTRDDDVPASSEDDNGSQFAASLVSFQSGIQRATSPSEDTKESS